MNPILCGTEIPQFLIFDFSTTPPLLFYTYIPSITLSLFLGFFTLIKDKMSLVSRLLFWITLFFSLWVLDILVLWIASYNDALYFGWQITPVFEVPIFLFSLYFTYVITDKTRADISDRLKYFFLAIMALVFILIPTKLNITLYDLTNCEGVVGRLWDGIYIFEIIVTFWVIGVCLNRYRTLKKDDEFGKQILLIMIGLGAFLSLFVGSNILGYIYFIEQVSFIGSLGMVVFLGFLSYVIVRYKLFNIKLLATQVLVIGITVLIGAQLFFPASLFDEVMIGITLVAFMFAGFYSIKSVKREIEAKEALKITNERLEDTTSLITHQIRGVFTRTKAGLSSIIEGDYGAVDSKLLNVSNLMFQSQEKGLNEVETFLQAQKIESGTIQYDRKPFDFKAVVEEIAAQEKPRAEKKGLQFEVHIDAGDYMLNGDQVYLTQVIANLIDNAIRYTEKGSIKVQLSRKGDKVVYSVKDSGVGIKDEDKPKMFTKYGHGAESRKINAASSGLGLYIVKGIVVGHGGEIRYETDTRKGTTFIVELPA